MITLHFHLLPQYKYELFPNYMSIATIICAYVLLGETKYFESFFVSADCGLRQY